MSSEDRVAITEVLYRYARAVDRKDFESLRRCYFPDAVDHHGGYVGTIDGLIEDIELRHRTIDSSMHFITNVIIDLEPSEQVADVESYCLCYLRQESEIGSSTHVLTTVKCRYVDRFERRDSEWRIADRVVVFDESLCTTVENVLDPGWVTSRRSQADPVFTRGARNSG
ncbi:nuclear transport factor 2 family protein [Rhodococcus sp. 14-2483-1-1]|uniref:nuclear transport factor 2 family protein n=1 Tax=Nocardiaceae TaxID=85025 RepID=UPI000568676E|nr:MULTISPECIES: nuclear transport factor 2 family protein [Rhodococcus]OZE81553.1 nuclear transport factor 2 family protein [Rhodococcus sp. 15-649-2-2]OZF29100.1 nuclear transport factor 2 family protein [Rhodococcus sp. 14-2483-1-1]QIH98681.1 nuclear transport factor 2 family protein [Rhodococcus fascians A21d2]